MSQQEKEKREKKSQQTRKIQFDTMIKFREYVENFKEVRERGDFGQFCENSIVVFDQMTQKKQETTMFIPSYVRCHFRNMTEMDIQNLSCSFTATMSISFYLGMYNIKDQKEKERAKNFADLVDQLLLSNLKITFQNDFVLDVEDDLTTNVSDSDRLIRSTRSQYEFEGIKRIYSNFTVTRQYKFGLRSDIFFFPLQQNDLDLVTTINPINVSFDKLKDQFKEGIDLTLRFNCMNIEIPLEEILKSKKLKISQIGNQYLEANIKDLYMHQYDGKQLNPTAFRQMFKTNKNNPFFRNAKISFPLKANSTQFGYYSLIENQIQIHYTREKQLRFSQSCYQSIKNVLFCRKNVQDYKNYQGHKYEYIHEQEQRKQQQDINSEDRPLEESHCNAIIKIPMLKASLGTIIQLCIPIFFLSFLSLVEFLYSQSSSSDVIRGQKIGSSILIVATYISFIYAMRTVIPPTPSWSIFQVAVCILAASTILPIIQVIYETNYQNLNNPFLTQNAMFIATFLIETFFCMLIIVMLIGIKLFKDSKTKRRRLQNVSMDYLLGKLTKKYFFVWRNADCYNYMRRKMEKLGKEGVKVRYEKWKAGKK